MTTTTAERKPDTGPAPRGTVARRAIEHLKSLPQGTELASAELAEAIGQQTSGFGHYLMPAAKAGLLTRRMSNGFAFWRLGMGTASSLPPRRRTPDEEDSAPPRILSVDATPSIFAYAKERCAAPFSTALATDGRLTIERHGRVIAELTDAERRMLIMTATQGVAAHE